jgi:acyl-CoA thioesterase
VTSDFDEDTAVSPDGEVTLTGRWNGIAGVVNGGYEMAVCAKALAWVMPHPDPLVISGFFLRPGIPGPATVRTDLLRAGRSMSFGTAALMQDGRETVRTTAVFSQPGHQNGLLFQAAGKPELPPPDDCVGYPPGQPGVAIAERIDYRFPELPGWARGGSGGGPSGNPSMQFWIRFADGSDASQFALPLLVDATAPAILELGAVSTTVELTVHVRARPAPGWLACRAVTRYVSGGYHEEDFEIWDSAGTLVAQSRQLCLILR